MLSCRQANQLDLVDHLSSLGYQAKKIRGHDHWYLSPLREERNASFVVNKQKNVWYDHGTGKGGTLIDFGLLYYRCSIKELLEKLSAAGVHHFPVQTMNASEETKKENDGKIRIISSTEINHKILTDYLAKRKIPLDIAQQYCLEVCFELHDRRQLAIGFQNTSGGYELRSPFFKGSSTPKEPKLISKQNRNELIVFEGFFSFLSYLALQKKEADFLILNSLAFFEKSRTRMEQYNNIHLCLDNDRMGEECTRKALQWSEKYKDQRKLYHPYKDLNEYLTAGLETRRNKGKSI